MITEDMLNSGFQRAVKLRGPDLLAPPLMAAITSASMYFE
jgi:hypothetical protein